MKKNFPVLLIFFAGSGCAALVYEVTWYQGLQLAIGSTSVSLGILLATFMGGLALGSLLLPRVRLTAFHPLKVFAAVEAGIGVLGVLVTLALPLIARVYIMGAEHGFPGMLLRSLVAALAMLPSTVLMGASLPAIVRWAGATPGRASRWALLYGSNTAGAVCGCLLAGFYLLRIYNMATAAYAAAALNLAVAVLAYSLGRLSPVEEGVEEESPMSPAVPAVPLWTVYTTAALSGACALGAEVIWTRVLGMLLMSTVYAFSIILAVILAGLAAGGALSSWLIRKANAALALGWCQFLIAAGIAWTAVAIAFQLPAWAGALPSAESAGKMFYTDFLLAAWAIFPTALVWGASLPLACAAASHSADEDPARVVGRVYAANTLGSIAGALGVSLGLIPWIGVQQSQQTVFLVAAAAGLFVLAPSERSRSMNAALGMAIAGVAIVAYVIPGPPAEMIAFGPAMRAQMAASELVYWAEGRNSSVAVTKWPNGTIYLSVNGHVEATTEGYDMRLQRMVAHLPGLAHSDPESVLGIGFGAGVSAGSFTRYPGIEHITVCEIEPVIPPTSARFFAPANYGVYSDPRTRIVYDDARHFLTTTTGKFDVIASDPLDVFAKGTAALYTREYFESVKRHLNPGGYFSLYVPLYQTDEPTIRSEIETFFQAFPDSTLWSNMREGKGYDMVFMATAGPWRLNLDEAQERLDRAEYAPVRESLREIGIDSVFDLYGTYGGQKRDVGRWSAGAAINTDANLRLSYLAGWGINSFAADELYIKMLQYRGEPGAIFAGSPETLKRMANAIRRLSP